MEKVIYLGNSTDQFLLASSRTASYDKPIICGHCNITITPFLIMRRCHASGASMYKDILLCPNCYKAITQLDFEKYTPSPRYGKEIEGLPEDLNYAYEEARSCISIGAYFATELLCRRMLMHIAVDKGDRDGKSFVEYIDYLENNDYITSTMKPWVDEIRKIGNIATHKIQIPECDRTELSLTFIEMLLRNIYEMPHKLGSFSKKP